MRSAPPGLGERQHKHDHNPPRSAHEMYAGRSPEFFDAMFSTRTLDLRDDPDQGHEGAGHQIPTQEEQQVPLLLQERPRQSLGEYWLD